MKWFKISLLCLFLSIQVYAQQAGEKKIVIITFDGLRWNDIFTGADSAKFFSSVAKLKNANEEVAKFWSPDAEIRKQKLMPFFWETIATKGQVYGNRYKGSFVNVTNPFWFSYPGYNEIFTGHADIRVNSNDYGPNPTQTVQEYINKQSGYKNSVAAFASWAAFSRILNKERCGFPVNAGYEEFKTGIITPKQQSLNETQMLLPKVFGNNERPDAITYYLAKEYMKQNHPKVLQISFIETDAYAHRNLYKDYLSSAYNNDKMLEDIWNYIQSDPFYKDQTTLFLANDHGRGGNESDDWTHHNSKTPGSDQIWFAVLSPDVEPLGEVKNVQIYQNQYAKTIAALLGIEFKSPDKVGDVIKSVIKK